jgi:hypothetical protein
MIEVGLQVIIQILNDLLPFGFLGTSQFFNINILNSTRSFLLLFLDTIKMTKVFLLTSVMLIIARANTNILRDSVSRFILWYTNNSFFNLLVRAIH